MNRLVWLKRQYRRRPAPAIATTIAGVDIVLGAWEGSFSLALFGIALGLGGGVLAWRNLSPSSHQPPQLFLPYSSSHAPLIQLEKKPTNQPSDWRD